MDGVVCCCENHDCLLFCTDFVVSYIIIARAKGIPRMLKYVAVSLPPRYGVGGACSLRFPDSDAV